MKPFFLLALLTTILFSCTKVKDVLDITVPFDLNNSFTLPKISDTEMAIPDSTVTIQSPDIPNTIKDDLKQKNADINNIKSVSLTAVVLNITNPAGKDFSFLKSIELYMGSQGLPEKLIASKDNINTINPASGTLSLDVKDSDIISYIKQDTYYIKTKMTLVKTYTTDLLIGSEIKGKVVANPLK
jgi:hypothetical protein